MARQKYGRFVDRETAQQHAIEKGYKDYELKDANIQGRPCVEMYLNSKEFPPEIKPMQ